jgi:acetylornithine deacetylase
MEVYGSTAGLDTRFSSYFGFPAIAFGPSGDHEHGFDEYVDLDSLPVVAQIVALATLEWCSQQKESP